MGGSSCWDTAVTETGPGPALTGRSVQWEVEKEIEVMNVGDAKKEEDKVLRLNNRKTRHGPGIWEGFPVEVIFKLRLEGYQGDC